MSDLGDQVESLRGVLPDAEVEALAAFVAELDTPEKLRRWQRKAAQRAAEERALVRAYERAVGRPVMTDADPSL